MVVLGFSSGLVVFSIVDGFLNFGLLEPGDVLGVTGGGAPGGGGVGCNGQWSSSLSDVEGMTSPTSVLLSDSSDSLVVFLQFLTEIAWTLPCLLLFAGTVLLFHFVVESLA